MARKKMEEQDSYRIAYLKLRYQKKKSVTIHSTLDENLSLPSILHVATKQSCINKNSMPKGRLEEQMTLDL